MFVCSYLTTRRGDAGCVASLENTLSGHLPDGPLFNTRANTTLTSQQNIIRRSHQEERRRRSKTFLQHNISSTQHVQHAHNLRCVRQDQASINQKSLVWHEDKSASTSQNSLLAKVWQQKCPQPRIRADLSRPGLWTGCW